MTSQIFVAKNGVLSAKTKTTLRKQGLIVVEVDDFSDVKFMTAETQLTVSELTVAAMMALTTEPGVTTAGAITTAGKQREAFVNNVAVAIRDAITAKKS